MHNSRKTPTLDKHILIKSDSDRMKTSRVFASQLQKTTMQRWKEASIFNRLYF